MEVIMMGIIALGLAAYVLRLQKRIHTLTRVLEGAAILTRKIADGSVEVVKRPDGAVVIREVNGEREFQIRGGEDE